ncbi:MAG: hypothetical protein QXM81_03105, partial [Nitrososphaerota archaeon]
MSKLQSVVDEMRERFGDRIRNVIVDRKIVKVEVDSSVVVEAARLVRALGHAVGTSDEDERLVAAVVDRLDGLPLAIEMAVAQLTSCTLPELVELLHTSLDEL